MKYWEQLYKECLQDLSSRKLEGRLEVGDPNFTMTVEVYIFHKEGNEFTVGCKHHRSVWCSCIEAIWASNDASTEVVRAIRAASDPDHSSHLAMPFDPEVLLYFTFSSVEGFPEYAQMYVYLRNIDKKMQLEGYFDLTSDSLNSLRGAVVSYLERNIIGEIRCQSKSHFRVRIDQTLIDLDDAVSMLEFGRCAGCERFGRAVTSSGSYDDLVPHREPNWRDRDPFPH